MNMPPPPGGWPPPPDPREPTWDRLFAPEDDRWGPPSAQFIPRPPTGRSRGPLIVVAAVAGVLVVVVVVGLVAWLLRPSAESGTGVAATSTSTSTSTPAVSAADTRLSALLPRGYAPDACTPVPPGPDAVATARCTRNRDAGGPVTATYTLLANRAALGKAFDGVVKASVTVECPGRILSPGPWRRNATASQVSGILFCGLQQGRPTVAWTDDARLLLSSVQGPDFGQLYAWWSSHS